MMMLWYCYLQNVSKLGRNKDQSETQESENNSEEFGYCRSSGVVHIGTAERTYEILEANGSQRIQSTGHCAVN